MERSFYHARVNDTRSRLVTATNELFRIRGYFGTSINDVVIGAEATNGSLYHFFPGGKPELAAAVLVESGESYRLLFEQIADEAGGAASAVAAFFDGAADVLEQIDFVEICPIGTVAREVASVDETLRAACASVFASWAASAATRFEQAGLDSEASHRLAGVVIATLEGAFVLARTHRDTTVVRDAGQVMSEVVERRLKATGRRGARSSVRP